MAVIAGLEAAFKWENNAIELKALAGNCQNYFREATYNKQKIEILTTDGEKLKELVQTIDMVNKDLEAIYSKATALGINLVRDLEKRRKALHKANKEATHEVKQ